MGLYGVEWYWGMGNLQKLRGGQVLTSMWRFWTITCCPAWQILGLMKMNDPKHTSRKARNWMEENNIMLLDWPPQSPDLNPIEHL